MAEQKSSQFRGQQRPIPTLAVPKHYDVKLKPDLAACKCSAAVQISVDVVSATNFLVLNAGSELSVKPKSASFASADKFLEAVEVELFADEKIVILEFKESLPLGLGDLTMEFEGALNDRVKGFCRSIYENKKTMSATEFDYAAEARQCFPSLDEPALCKATFKIALQLTPDDVAALFNKPIVEEKQNKNLNNYVRANGLAENGSNHQHADDNRLAQNGQVLLIPATIMTHFSIRACFFAPVGFWNEEFSGDNNTRKYEQYLIFNLMALVASLSVIFRGTSELPMCRRRWWTQVMLMQIAISALALAYSVVLFDITPEVSVLVWASCMAMVYVLKKCVRVDEEKRERKVLVCEKEDMV